MTMIYPLAGVGLIKDDNLARVGVDADASRTCRLHLHRVVQGGLAVRRRISDPWAGILMMLRGTFVPEVARSVSIMHQHLRRAHEKVVVATPRATFTPEWVEGSPRNH